MKILLSEEGYVGRIFIINGVSPGLLTLEEVASGDQYILQFDELKWDYDSGILRVYNSEKLRIFKDTGLGFKYVGKKQI